MCMSVFCPYAFLCICMCTMCAVHRGQKKVLELRVTVSHPASAGNQTQVLRKGKCSYLLSGSSSSCCGVLPGLRAVEVWP